MLNTGRCDIQVVRDEDGALPVTDLTTLERGTERYSTMVLISSTVVDCVKQMDLMSVPLITAFTALSSTFVV